MRPLSQLLVAVFLVAGLSACIGGPPLVVANDNRVAAGMDLEGVRDIVLEARPARWRPDDGVDSTLTVQAFAERDGTPRVPGPLVRVVQGTPVRVTVINSVPDSALVVHFLGGLRNGAAGDSVRVLPGESQVIEYTADTPGTFLYWATTTGSQFFQRTGVDAQLTGAIIVDPAGAPVDTSERVFVITMMDVLPDTTKPLEGQNDIFDLAINGKSWPYTEALSYALGDTVRWRWVNGGQLTHPMHLHGFHFMRLAKGSGAADTTYAEADVTSQVTEFMYPRSTFRMAFVPTRPGNWLFHCHMSEHMKPFPERPDSVREHAMHEVEDHARVAMSGLVMNVAITGSLVLDSTPPARRERLLVQQGVARDTATAPPRGFVLQRGADPRPDSIEIPGTPLILTRGERVGITVVNRLNEPTSIHWHGMELDGYFDGVLGWSGADSRRSPMVAPGDSFAVTFTPPRAGTFMYHPHMEEEKQLAYGLFGAMIVLEPGERFDPRTDRLFVLGNELGDGTLMPSLNSERELAPMAFEVGTTYRLRFINILAQLPMDVALVEDTTLLSWTAYAKDGADLPASRRISRPSHLIFGVGETYDFLWTPDRVMDAAIVVKSAGPEPGELRQPLRVRR